MLRYLETDSARLVARLNEDLDDSLQKMSSDPTISEDNLHSEFIPLDLSENSTSNGKLNKFSVQFQETIDAIKKLDQKLNTQPFAPKGLRHFKDEKINISVPENLENTSETSSCIRFGNTHHNSSLQIIKKHVPDVQVKEAALLKCAYWLDTNEQFVSRPVSSRVKSAWKKEKNVVAASKRVKSSQK